MLPRAHLTSHSRMSNSKWVITPSWLFVSLRPLLYSFYVYSCHFFLISSASVRTLLCLPFILPILAWMVPWISPIIWKTSLFIPILLFSSITLHSSLKGLSYLPLLFSGTLSTVGYSFPFPPCLALLIFPHLFLKPPQTTTLPSCISFSLEWFWSLPPT